MIIPTVAIAMHGISQALEGVRFIRCDRCVWRKNCETLQRCTPVPINHEQFHAYWLSNFAKTQRCDSDGGECD